MTHTVRLKFDDIDNTTLQRLCGALDENLTALGKALSVQTSRRFADFTFIGDNAHAARRALLALADTAQSPRPNRRRHPACRRGSQNRRRATR